jgi:hypothetical protein
MMATTVWKNTGTAAADYNDPAAWTNGVPSSTTPGLIDVPGTTTIVATSLALTATTLQFAGGEVVFSVSGPTSVDSASRIDIAGGTSLSLDGAGGIINNGTVTVENGGAVSESGAFVNNGSVRVAGAGSLFDFGGAISGVGTVAVAAGAEIDLPAQVTGNSIEFLDTTGTIGVEVGAAGLTQIAVPLLGFSPGDTVRIIDPAIAPAATWISAYVQAQVMSIYNYGTLIGTLDVPGVPDGAPLEVDPQPTSGVINYLAGPTNLVENNSFEDDGAGMANLVVPVSRWTLSESPLTINAGETTFHDPVLAGVTYLAIGTVGHLGFVSQAIPTVAGQTYTFSFSFSSDGAAGNEFEALWNGSVIMNAANTPFNPDWNNLSLPDSGTAAYSFTEMATSSSTTIAFGGMGNGSSYVGIDNVSVTPATLCFLTGTLIDTPEGQIAVEHLAAGDLVLTFSGAVRRIAWVGAGRVLATRGRRNAATPVIVRKGALADNVPHHDLRVTKGHSFYLDDVLIPAEFLVNHRSIIWDDRAQEVELYHIELETHDVLIANGAPAESYRDDGNRWLFQNANIGWGLSPQPPCAPVLAGGPVVDATWRRLLDRAGSRPGVPMTDDPDLHLVVDGVRIDGKRRDFNVYTYRLAGPVRSVHLASRSGVPQELGLTRDPRELGVALRQVVLWRGAEMRLIEASQPVLSDGFHDFEETNGFRWTNGDAVIPDAIFDGIDGPFELELHIGCTSEYLLDHAATRSLAA